MISGVLNEYLCVVMVYCDSEDCDKFVDFYDKVMFSEVIMFLVLK